MFQVSTFLSFTSTEPVDHGMSSHSIQNGAGFLVKDIWEKTMYPNIPLGIMRPQLKSICGLRAQKTFSSQHICGKTSNHVYIYTGLSYICGQ